MRDALFLETQLQALTPVLVRFLAASQAGEGPVLRQRPIAEILRGLDFDRLRAEGGGDLAGLAEKILKDCNRLHHPRYMGHQVAAPLIPSALADLVYGLTNNGMAVYEMGPAGTAIEKGVTDWMLGLAGWTEGAGILTHGGSLANLSGLLAARAEALPEAWDEGVRGRNCFLVSEASHYSIARIASILGFGREAVWPLATDGQNRVLPESLRERHREALDRNFKIVAVCVNAGATTTGVYDPLAEIGAFCRDQGLWMHVDGAHGASALLSPRYKGLLQGLEFADSLSWDTHKILGTSTLCGAALFRRRSALERTYHQQASYLYAEESQRPGEDLGRHTFECTKSMLGLKVFFNLAVLGEKGLAAHVEGLYDKAREAYHRIENRDRTGNQGRTGSRSGFSCLGEPMANILCFRYRGDLPGASALQDAIRDRIVTEGDFYITRATVKGEAYLRLVLMNPLTGMDPIEALLRRIEDIAEEMGPGRP